MTDRLGPLCPTAIRLTVYWAAGGGLWIGYSLVLPERFSADQTAGNVIV